MKAAFSPLASSDGLPVSLGANPLVSAWLRIDPSDGQHVHVLSGKVELGQNILTALAQIAAHELGVDVQRIIMVPARTGTSPDESITSGSLSIQHSGMALRVVCRHARRIFTAAAAARAGRPAADIVARDGRFYAGGDCCGSYWDLAGGVDLDVPAQAGDPPPGQPPAAQNVVAFGMREKANGRYRYIHDLELPGMVHGCMLRPPSLRARLLSLDPQAAHAIAGVLAVVRDGSLVGVLAQREHTAQKALAALAQTARWHETACLPDPSSLAAWMREQPCDTTVYQQAATLPAAHGPVARTLQADFFKPFIKHGSIGPSCACAQTDAEGRLHVWSHTQGVYNLRADLALAFGMRDEDIVVAHVPGAGCYGHNGADDVAFDAAWLSRHAQGRPVRVQWSRADELCWSPQGPPMSIRIEADVDAQGNILDWRQDVWGPGHSLRPGRAATPTLLGSWHRERPSPMIAAINAPLAAGGGMERNLAPSYDIPCSALSAHRLLDMPVRTSSLRCLGAFGNVFAIESMLDDMALELGRDPVDFRLGLLGDPRARDVLAMACEQSGWRHRHAPNRAHENTGWGVGYARYKNKGAYCAVVAQVHVGEKVRVEKLVVCVDVGEVINPDGVAQQIEGGAIQACSWALMESARFDDTRLLDADWEAYPILRFSDVPDVQVHIMDRPDKPPLGAGEPSLGPTAAAIGNAVRDALGVRVRALPLSFEQIAQAIEAGA